MADRVAAFVTNARPTCKVRFMCPVCKAQVIHDAYRGPVLCEVKEVGGDPEHPDPRRHPLTIMRPCNLVEPNPLSDDMRGARKR